MLFVKVPFFIVLKTALAQRFRGFMPVVVDIETGGFNAATDAMLEIAAVLVDVDATQGWHRTATISHGFRGDLRTAPSPGSDSRAK